MKKLWILWITLLLLPIPVLGREYSLEKLEISLDFPASYDIYTRENYQQQLEEEPSYYIKEQIKDAFSSERVELLAYDGDRGIDILLMSEEKDSEDYRRVSDTRLVRALEEYEETLENNGYDVLSTKIEKINDIPYFWVEYEKSIYTVYIYATILEGKSYIFAFEKGSSFSSEEEEEIREMMQSVTFEGISEASSPSFSIIIFCIPVLCVVIALITLLITGRKKNKNQAMRCPVCGNAIVLGQHFCPNCGNFLEGSK